MPKLVEACEYCDSKDAISHCNDCGKALCSLCQNEDERGMVKCLSCSDQVETPLIDEDVEENAIAYETPFDIG